MKSFLHKWKLVKRILSAYSFWELVTFSFTVIFFQDIFYDMPKSNHLKFLFISRQGANVPRMIFTFSIKNDI